MFWDAYPSRAVSRFGLRRVANKRRSIAKRSGVNVNALLRGDSHLVRTQLEGVKIEYMFIKDLCSSQLDKAALDKGNAKRVYWSEQEMCRNVMFRPKRLVIPF
jgi:hypothetical protein